MSKAVSTDTLYAIQERDPNGGEAEPTVADRIRFYQWVLRTYGDRAWAAYERGNWAPKPEV